MLNDHHRQDRGINVVRQKGQVEEGRVGKTQKKRHQHIKRKYTNGIRKNTKARKRDEIKITPEKGIIGFHQINKHTKIK